jgi:hypothetical protein
VWILFKSCSHYRTGEKTVRKVEKKKPESEFEFAASIGWCHSFLKRTGLKSVLVRGEGTLADVGTANKSSPQISEEVEGLL